MPPPQFFMPLTSTAMLLGTPAITRLRPITSMGPSSGRMAGQLPAHPSSTQLRLPTLPPTGMSPSPRRAKMCKGSSRLRSAAAAFFLSADINVSAAGLGTTGDYFIHLDDGTTTNFFDRVFTKASGSDFVMAVSTSSGTTPTFRHDCPEFWHRLSHRRRIRHRIRLSE